MTDKKKTDQDLAILDAVYHEVGMDAADKAGKRKRTPERQAKVDRILTRARASLQTARKQAFADAQAEPPAASAKPVPARILAMARDAIVARLRDLMGDPGEAGLTPAMQFRKLDDLPDDDLRRLLADLEEQIENGRPDDPGHT